MPSKPSTAPSKDAEARPSDSKGARVLWKGAISFGLVHIPVALHAAAQDSSLDFDWLDRRTMDPVGYQRINKKTQQPIAADDIVKGLEVEPGRYVIVTNEELKAAFPKATQSIEIEGFVPVGDVPFVHMERPYYLAPINRGEKVYALLREALKASGKAAIAKVVIQSKQNLAVLIPDGEALILNLLRWGDEIKPRGGLNLPAEGVEAAGIKPAELKMAQALIDEMSTRWDATQWHDSFREQILALVARKEAEGEVATVDLEGVPKGAVDAETGAQIIDLTELLKRSLSGAGAGVPAADAGGKKTAKAAAGGDSGAAAKTPARRAARNKAA